MNKRVYKGSLYKLPWSEILVLRYWKANKTADSIWLCYKVFGKMVKHSTQYTKRTLNEIEKTFNETFAGWKSMGHGRWILHFNWAPISKPLEFAS